MAEIHVERKRGSMGWLWMVVLLIAVGLLGWWLWQNGMLGTPSEEVIPVDTLSLGTSSLGTPSLVGSVLSQPYA